ncbi:MAG: Na/Pi cotransporter family protein [Prevotellaceae bacterium]|jgi:phosphate:Na+ symporter|nr:Na/Pi cotransporter family protein [Prevotellaceae bacterium]
MNYTLLDFLKLLGSLGMFLYGMKIMSEGLQKIAGNKLRRILSAMTANRFMGVFTGVLITALIQSSSATTVMVVSFVNAKILSLAQSVSVIMGANIGTTVTAWIISIFGFKVDIGIMVLPLIGFAIPFMFSKRSSNQSWAEFIMGFAFLFMGLEFLKTNVPDVQSNPDMLAFLRNYSNMGYASILLFVFIGSLLTIIVQSSSATVAITLIMCSQGWISFEIACATILGENIGTTVTANLAALSANVSAKRAAFAHFMFNVFGVIWTLALFYPFTRMIASIVSSIGPGNPHQITEFLANLDTATISAITSGTNLSPELEALRTEYIGMQTAVSYSLSLFHSTFNLINVTTMIWFVNVYVKICTKLIKSRKPDEEFQLKHISAGILSTAELSILQAKQETLVYAERMKRMLNMCRELYYEKNERNFLKTFGRIEKYENISDRMEVEIGNYLRKVSEGRLSAASKEVIRDILRVITEIESVGDSMYNMARTINRRNENHEGFTPELDEHAEAMLELIAKALDRMIEVLNIENPQQSDMDVSSNLENEINTLRNKLKMHNIEDVNSKKYDYTVGVIYMDFIAECEKLGDYAINVVEAWCNVAASTK